MREEIDTKNSWTAEARLIRLQQKMPLLRRWARRWHTSIRATVTSPQGASSEPGIGTVKFNPYATTPYASSPQKELKSIFGYELPVTAEARTRLSPHYTAQQFLSTASNRIAQTYPGNVSFLVDILGQDWPGSDEVADILLACTLPRALPESHRKLRARRLRDVLKRKLRRDHKKIEVAYLQLVRGYVSSTIEQLEREAQRAAEKMADHEHKRLVALKEIAELEGYLTHAETRVKSPEQLGEEFDQILRMKGVGTVRIVGESSGEDWALVIVIYTERIFQQTDNQVYDIGSFQIKIDPTKLGREAVRFTQEARGNFRHPHAVPQPQNGALNFQICFGNDTQTGLNAPVGKLAENFDMVPLTHLLLSFLRLDQTSPVRETAQYPRTEDIPAQLNYASPADREKERAMFVKVTSETLVRVASKKSRIRLAQLIADEKAASAMYYSARRERNEFKARAKLLKECLKTLTDSTQSAIHRLLLNPSVLYARVYEKNLQAWFWNHKTSSIHMVWLDPQRSPWIISYEKLDCVALNHSFDTRNDKFKRRLLKLLASGKLSQAAEFLIGHISSSER